jgi:Asp/Glu/hydantoin racemase
MKSTILVFVAMRAWQTHNCVGKWEKLAVQKVGARPRIALIHATPVAIEPTHAALRTCWPEAEAFDLLDSSLTLDRDAGQELERFSGRLSALANHAQVSGANGVLYTCSAFGPIIEEIANRASIPILKPNKSMFCEALRVGRHIAMIATHAPAVPELTAEFVELAQGRATLTAHFAKGALAALREGQGDEHDARIVAVAKQIRDADAIMLAHFSTSRAEHAVAQVTSIPVLTAPGTALAALRAAISHRSQQDNKTNCIL